MHEQTDLVDRGTMHCTTLSLNSFVDTAENGPVKVIQNVALFNCLSSLLQTGLVI